MKNNAFAQVASKWARWYAPLPRPGYYDVSVYIPANIGTTRQRALLDRACGRVRLAHAQSIAVRESVGQSGGLLFRRDG